MGGAAKGLIETSKGRLIDQIIERIEPLCEAVYLIGDASAYANYPLSTMPDLYENQGPVSGIGAALETLQSDVLIVPCDLPNLTVSVFERLLNERSDHPLACRTAQRTHPLVSVWPKNCAETVAQFARDGRSVHATFEACHGQWLTFSDEALFININTPDDLRALQ